jgi:protein Mpv17
MFPENEEFSWDALRALSGAAFGVIATSYLHLWWNGLEGVVERLWPVAKGKLGHTAVKVFIDQSMGAPMYIYSYYTVTNFLQALGGNKSAPEAWRGSRAKADQILWPTMLRHWKLWPVVHSFNFYFVPLHHRVLVQNMVLVGWSGCEFKSKRQHFHI